MTLRIDNLQKRFGDTQALTACSLEVSPGRLVGFLGPNGAGKTTTMRAILGLVAIDRGNLSWHGETLTESHRRRIGYMPQERGLYVRMKVHEHITYIGRLAGVEKREAARRADHWVDRVGLTDRRDDLIQELSVGNQQRVQLAVALVHQPDLLVLDEPFAGLDPVAVSTLSEVMLEEVERGVAVLFSSHQLDLVQDICEDVTIINSGSTVTSGTVSGLRSGSAHRMLELQWHGVPPTWMPSGAMATDRPNRFVLPASADPAALMAEAARHGQVAGFTFEPPALDQVFLELVGS